MRERSSGRRVKILNLDSAQDSYIDFQQEKDDQIKAHTSQNNTLKSEL
jgi:hypothetical protein